MDNTLIFRSATRDDLHAIVTMLTDDMLGTTREGLVDDGYANYLRAFEHIENDANNDIIVACKENTIIACLQITFIPNLTFQGSWRALIEGVRVHNNHRAKGVGEALLQNAIEQAKSKHCRIVQLTTDKTRTSALRFYERLGFIASHEGMKLMLNIVM